MIELKIYILWDKLKINMKIIFIVISLNNKDNKN
jgi:hypothetical protein